MIKRKSFIALFMFLLTLIFSINGFSAWVLRNNTGDISISDDVMHTINIYYQTTEYKKEYVEYSPYPNATAIPGSGGSYSKSTAQDAVSRYNTCKEINKEYNIVTNQIDDGGKFRTYDMNSVCSQTWGHISGLSFGYMYTITWTSYKQYTHSLETVEVKSDLSTQEPKSILIKNNTFLKPIDVIENFENCGFYTDSSFSTFFDFSTPITSDKNIYIKYLSVGDSLAKIISSNTGSLDIYDSARNTSAVSGYNINSKTNTYDSNSKTGFLAKTTINNGSTVNLTYGTNSINLSPVTGAIDYSDITNHRNQSDDFVSVLVTDKASTPNVCALKIKLSGDLTVKGNLVIGAKIGSNGSTSKYSFIIGDYTELDLNGHNLIIDSSGVVTAYGLISDTIGTGKIIVNNGGTLRSTFTVFDGRGGNQSVWGYSKGQTPFTHYCSPYITAKMQFNYGSTFTAYLKVDLGSLGISNAYLNFLSMPGNNSLFEWNSSNTSGIVYINPYIVTDLYNSNAYYDQINKDLLFRRFEIDVNANLDLSNSSFTGYVQIEAAGITVDQDFDLYLSRTDLPISPVFDFIIRKNSTVSINYVVVFYPGSSLYTEKGSTINFKYYGLKQYDDVTVTALFVPVKTLPGETKYLASGLIAHCYNLTHFNTYVPFGFSSNGVYVQSDYYNFFKPANIQIEGELKFDSNIDTSKAKYSIAGPINISESGINSIKTNKNYISTYYLKGEQNGSVWIPSNISNLNNIFSNQDAYIKVASYDCSPLISYNKAYIYDSNNSIEGTFDFNTGIISSGTNNYFLKPEINHILSGGSSTNESSQNSAADNRLTVVTVTDNLEIGIVNSALGYYVYFGGVFIPVTTITDSTHIIAELNRFHSNVTSSYETSTIFTSYSGNLTYDSTAKKWDFVSCN